MQVTAQNSIDREEPALPSLFLAYKGIFTGVDGARVCWIVILYLCFALRA